MECRGKRNRRGGWYWDENLNYPIWKFSESGQWYKYGGTYIRHTKHNIHGSKAKEMQGL